MAKTNWNKIKLEYIKTTASYRNLAKKYGISGRQIAARGKAESWVEKRKQFRSKTYANALARARVTEEENLKRISGLTEKVIANLEEALSDPEQFKKYLVEKTTYEDGMPVTKECIEREFTKFDTKSIRNLTSALKDLHAISQSTLAMGEDDADSKEITVKIVAPEEQEEASEWSY